jgi:hypothetical protein
MTTLAEEIRDAILDDVTDRKGWRHAWDDFDEDIQEEIKDVWLIVINEVLEERGVPKDIIAADVGTVGVRNEDR